MTRRVMITLPDPLGDRLNQHATREGQRVSTVAAELIRDALGRVAQSNSRSAALSRPQSNHRPAPWIEPADETSAAWRSETWMAILALCARYAKELARLENDWWLQPSRVETLAALAEWRMQIDHHATDPREELAFQGALADLRYALEHTPGVGTATFHPDQEPPSSWLFR